MLIEMGFSEDQAQTAMRNIDYPDVNLAAEWLFSHPEVPAQQEKIEIKQEKPLDIEIN